MKTLKEIVEEEALRQKKEKGDNKKQQREELERMVAPVLESLVRMIESQLAAGKIKHGDNNASIKTSVSRTLFLDERGHRVIVARLNKQLRKAGHPFKTRMGHLKLKRNDDGEPSLPMSDYNDGKPARNWWTDISLLLERSDN